MRRVIIERGRYRYTRDRREWVKNPRNFSHLLISDYAAVVREIPGAQDYQWHVIYYPDSIVVKVTNSEAIPLK